MDYLSILNSPPIVVHSTGDSVDWKALRRAIIQVYLVYFVIQTKYLLNINAAEWTRLLNKFRDMDHPKFVISIDQYIFCWKWTIQFPDKDLYYCCDHQFNEIPQFHSGIKNNLIILFVLLWTLFSLKGYVIAYMHINWQPNKIVILNNRRLHFLMLVFLHCLPINAGKCYEILLHSNWTLNRNVLTTKPIKFNQIIQIFFSILLVTRL